MLTWTTYFLSSSCALFALYLVSITLKRQCSCTMQFLACHSVLISSPMLSHSLNFMHITIFIKLKLWYAEANKRSQKELLFWWEKILLCIYVCQCKQRELFRWYYPQVSRIFFKILSGKIMFTLFSKLRRSTVFENIGNPCATYIYG